MGTMSRAYAGAVLERLSRIDPAASPAWGEMTVDKMYGHLNQAVLYTMGHGPEFTFRGNWKTRYLVRPLILGQIVKIPRNVRLPNPDGSRKPPVIPDGSVDEIRASLDEYLRRFEIRDLPSRTHPFFGQLSPAGWQRFHYAHFEHHLAQFEA